MTPEQQAALDIARALAAYGVPIFLAHPDPSEGTGYRLPSGWQNTKADPSVIDSWRPGMALGAVMGCGLDLVDVDSYKGSEGSAELQPIMPKTYGAASTPSGGLHFFIRTMGVPSRNGVFPGVDVKAGAPDGRGRGFAFIAPTVRVSKSTQQPTPYRWHNAPDLTRLASANDDMTGRELAARITGARHKAAEQDPGSFMAAGPWTSIEATLANGRNDGVARLAAGLRGRGGFTLDDALAVMDRRVWPLIDQTQGGHEFTREEFETTIEAAWRQYPDGAEQREAEAAVPPTSDGTGAPVAAPSPARYFAEGGLQAATLAGDVMGLGPLRMGSDSYTWAYEGGVWRPDKDAIQNRVSRLLGQRHRHGHLSTVTDIVKAYVETITCDPVSDLVNFRNGLLDWRTGELVPHSPDVPSTVQMTVDYDPGAECPLFDKFLAEVLPDDMVPVVWELIGYLMYSGNPLHKAVMLTGHGRNGKGTFLRVMLALLGRHNTVAVSLQDLVDNRFAAADLFGKIANIAGDIDASYIENTAKFKGITGGDTVRAEHKNQPSFQFTPWAVPVFSANKIPASADTTTGYLSRWLVVPFPYDFSGREDTTLDVKLCSEAELRGVAVKGVRALPALLNRGRFAETVSGETAREEFVRRVDQVRTWLNECAEINAELPWTPRTPLYEAYKRWAMRDGYRPVRASEFFDRIESAGAYPAKIRGDRGFYRIRVTDDGWTSSQGGWNLPEGDGGAGTQPSDKPTPDGPKTGAGTQAEVPLDPPPAETDLIQSVKEATCPNDKTAGQVQSEPKSGAMGAAHPYPHMYDAHTGGDRDLPALLPPGDSGPAPVDPKAEAKAAKARAKAEAKAAELRAAVEAAGGPVVDLPALVLRDGTVRSITVADADELLTTITSTDAALTVDVENTGYPVGHADYALRTVQLGNRVFAVDFDPLDPGQAEVVKRHMAAAAKLHAHSATADGVPLVVAGLADWGTFWDRMYDTVIPAKLSDPSSTGSDPGLKKLAQAVLGDRATAPAADVARAELFKAGRWMTETKVTTPVERSGWAQVNSGCTTMVRYAASDVLDTGALAEELPPVDPGILVRERTVQQMVARVALDGLRIDGEHVHKLLVKHTAARTELAERIRLADGITNPGSDKQVADKLAELGANLPRTKTGRPSVAAGVLEPLRDAQGRVGDLASLVLDYRHHDTALTLFIEPFERLVTRGDGRVRSTIYTLGADTGRMSSTRFNLQQLSKQGGIRAMICADPGFKQIGADFASVEIRVAAALSGDGNLRRMILEGIDLHWLIARQVFGPDATKADRYRVKRGVFGRLYGGGIDTLAKQLGVSHQVCQAMMDTLDAMTPELTEWSRMVREGVEAGRTQFRTYSGRVIHLPASTPHAAPNYCIQGTARELLMDALLAWRQTRWGDAVLWPVHDEVDAMVPEAEADSATEELVRCMSMDLAGIPIVAEASEPSYSWADAS